jgi:hypothetical protein
MRLKRNINKAGRRTERLQIAEIERVSLNTFFTPFP